jgi:hypothetical protein
MLFKLKSTVPKSHFFLFSGISNFPVAKSNLTSYFCVSALAKLPKAGYFYFLDEHS